MKLKNEILSKFAFCDIFISEQRGVGVHVLCLFCSTYGVDQKPPLSHLSTSSDSEKIFFQYGQK